MFVPAAKMQGATCAVGALASATAAWLNTDTPVDGRDIATAFGVAAACQVHWVWGGIRRPGNACCSRAAAIPVL